MFTLITLICFISMKLELLMIQQEPKLIKFLMTTTTILQTIALLRETVLDEVWLIKMLTPV